MKEPVIEKIRIANLHLDLRNFRFEEQHSQKEAIATMIADQKNKLVALAKDIFENGLNPTDLIIVVRLNEGNNQYRVLEGNRRVTCLKLINNPGLIPNEFANIRRQFQRLAANEDRANQLRRPACAIFEYEEEADIWIERKHSGEQDGKGTIAWNSLQKSRYEAFHGAKDSLPLQVVNFIKRMAEEDESLKTIASNISNTTNIDRLLSDPYVREKLMLKIQNGRLISFDTKERITKKFVRLIEIVSQPSFTVNYIKHKSDRKIFIDDFYEHLDDKDNIILSKGWDLNEPTSSQPITPQNQEGFVAEEPIPVHNTKPRGKLIPDSIGFIIDEQRIAKVFKELSGMLLNIHPNAIAVLFRVFVELSVDCFIERSGLLPDGCLTSSSSRNSLKDKIETCIENLKGLGRINNDLAKGITSELNDENSPLGIKTMNSYIHNFHFSPKADNLRIGWDNIEPFLTILWQNMPEKR